MWLIVIGLVVSRHRALRRWNKRVGTAGVTHRQSVWFWLGIVGFWVASDWPVGTLGAGYLLSVHMAQYLLYTFMATPLLLLSVPEWRMRQFVARTHLYGTLKLVTRVLPAVLMSGCGGDDTSTDASSTDAPPGEPSAVGEVTVSAAES